MSNIQIFQQTSYIKDLIVPNGADDSHAAGFYSLWNELKWIFTKTNSNSFIFRSGLNFNLILESDDGHTSIIFLVFIS